MGYEVDGKMGVGASLPLGMLGSGVLLGVFTLVKSSISLQLVAARGGHKNGFPFIFETVLIFPFTMQALFYTCQTVAALGLRKGLTLMVTASASMGPCLFYAGFITCTTLLETYSLQFIRPSTFVVLKQLTMVVIAVGEVIMFSVRPSRMAWTLILCQVVCIALFQCSHTVAPHMPSVIVGGTPSHHKGPDVVHPHRVLGMNTWTAGMTACLISVATGGIGSILQQRFLQGQAKDIPVSVKLCYQHAIELFWVVMLLIASEESNHLWASGFFGGWNLWTYCVSLTMWFAMLAGSAISANISVLAGAFAIAVSVVLTGLFEYTLFGRSFTHIQFSLMACVCFIAVLYTRERVAMLSREEPENRALLPKQP